MLKNLFKRKRDSVETNSLDIFTPIEGEIISIEDTPDEVFAGKMLGDGFAIKPHGNKIYSPVSGEIKVLFPTLHAIAIKTQEGVELLVHIGIDTVELDGEGFVGHVKVGDIVKQGDLLVSFDKAIVETKAKSSITPVIITNMDVVDSISVNYGNKDLNERTARIVLK